MSERERRERTVPRRAWVEQIMGMPISVQVRGPLARGPAAEAAVAQVFAALRAADAVFSTYRPDSDISRLARGELALEDCHPDVVEVADLCEQAGSRTGGWFDPVVRDPSGEGHFDPTGLVKSWAVQRAADALSGLDGHDFCLNAGGDVLTRCSRTDTPPWRVGIEDPADRSRLLDVAVLRDGGVATSGIAARGAHIYDPFTGAPARGLASVTVTGPSLLWADVYATAGFARGADAAEWLTELAGYAALVVARDGRVTRVRWAQPPVGPGAVPGRSS